MSYRVKKPFTIQKKLIVILKKGDYRPFLVGAGEEIIKDNISNILHQRTPSGGVLQKNSPLTLKIKSRLGKGVLSLIWDRILIKKSTWFQKHGKKFVKVFLKPERSKIGQALRKMGYEFFGISIGARVKILNRWRAFLKRGLK